MSDASATLERVLAGLAGPGYAVVEDAVPAEICAAARAEIAEAREQGRFRAAGIGRAEGRRVEGEVRRDGILWFEPGELSPAQGRIWTWLEELRVSINRELLLGLWDLEGHWAVYPPGGYYRKHLDRFANDSRRVVSVVIYFNEKRSRDDGGLLVLDLPDGPKEVVPLSGTAVFFLSDRIAHEVTDSRVERLSFAGWFRQRT